MRDKQWEKFNLKFYCNLQGDYRVGGGVKEREGNERGKRKGKENRREKEVRGRE